MKAICILLAVILSGCAAYDPPVEVKVPVAISCITIAPESPKTTPDADIVALSNKCKSGEEVACYAAVTSIHSDRLNLQAYRLKAEAVMSGCVIR